MAPLSSLCKMNHLPSRDNNNDGPMVYNRQQKQMKKSLLAIALAVAALCTSCGTDEPNIPTGSTASQPLTFEEMNAFRSMDQSAIVAMMEERGYSSYYGTHHFYKGNEEVSFEYNEYELLSVSYSCREEGALRSGKMKRLFTDALDDAKTFCEGFTLDRTSFYAMVNEEQTPDVDTEEELLAFIDNCNRSVMNDGYALFYCQGFTITIHFIGDNLDKSIRWDPTSRYTFNGTTWLFHSVSDQGIIDLGDGVRLDIKDKIEFKGESSGTYTYHRIMSVPSYQTIISDDSIELSFTYNTEMSYDNEYFIAHISQLENIGIDRFSARADQGIGVTHVYMPELGEEVTLLYTGTLNPTDAR